MADAGQANDQARQDAKRFWGPMFQRNKCPTEKLERLLVGIAHCISTKYGRDEDDCDLTPGQLASFYHEVGGNYDPLFLDMPSQSVAFIYQSLGCLHSIQPSATADGSFASPTIPALKPRGFVTWQTIQLLLGPEEHVPFIQNALSIFNVQDPVDRKPFPKFLPSELFPPAPDEQMVVWHQNVSEQLRVGAQQQQDEAMRLQAPHAHHGPPNDFRRRSSHSNEPASSATTPEVSHPDGRVDAAAYFGNPHYKTKDGRPAIVRKITKAMPDSVKQGGSTVALTMRNIASPYLWNSGNNNANGNRRHSSLDRHAHSNQHHRDSHASPYDQPPSRHRDNKASYFEDGNSRPYVAAGRRERPPPRERSISSGSSIGAADSLPNPNPSSRRRPGPPRRQSRSYDRYHRPETPPADRNERRGRHEMRFAHFDPRDRDRDQDSRRSRGDLRSPPPTTASTAATAGRRRGESASMSPFPGSGGGFEKRNRTRSSHLGPSPPDDKDDRQRPASMSDPSNSPPFATHISRMQSVPQGNHPPTSSPKVAPTSKPIQPNSASFSAAQQQAMGSSTLPDPAIPTIDTRAARTVPLSTQAPTSPMRDSSDVRKSRERASSSSYMEDLRKTRTMSSGGDHLSPGDVGGARDRDSSGGSTSSSSAAPKRHASVGNKQNRDRFANGPDENGSWKPPAVNGVGGRKYADGTPWSRGS